MQMSLRNVFQIAMVTMATMFLINIIKPRSAIVQRIVNSNAGTAQRNGPTVLDAAGRFLGGI